MSPWLVLALGYGAGVVTTLAVLGAAALLATRNLVIELGFG